MPYPSARSRFGIAPMPYQSYFPSAPDPVAVQQQYLQANPYNAAFAAFDPVEAELETIDLDTPEGISGLQRLIGQGKVDPRRANSMVASQRLLSGSHKDLDAQQAQFLAELHGIDPRNKDYFQKKAALIGRYDPAVLTRPEVNRYLEAYDSHALRGVGGSGGDKGVLSAYGKTVQSPTDPEKEAWLKKNVSEDRKKWKSEDWKQAWHAIQDPRFEALRGQIAASEAAGRAVPDEVKQWLVSQYGAPAAVSAQSVAAPAVAAQPQAQSTEGGQKLGQFPVVNSVAELKSMNLPKGSYFQTPDGQVRMVK